MIKNTQTEDREDFQAAWDAPVVERPDEFEAEAEKRTLLEQLPDGEKLAAGDGVSIQSKQAISALDKSLSPTKPPEQVAPNNNPGKDDEMSTGVKRRNYDSKKDETIKMFQRNGDSPKQAEDRWIKARP